MYGHLFEGIDQDAADRLDETVRKAGADQTPPQGAWVEKPRTLLTPLQWPYQVK
jgi:hypothetical protein